MATPLPKKKGGIFFFMYRIKSERNQIHTENSPNVFWNNCFLCHFLRQTGRVSGLSISPCEMRVTLYHSLKHEVEVQEEKKKKSNEPRLGTSEDALKVGCRLKAHIRFRQLRGSIVEWSCKQRNRDKDGLPGWREDDFLKIASEVTGISPHR